MNDNAQPSAAKASARRRLLRGAFSAPAVLTLYSGGALASASSQRCMDNQLAAPLASPTVANTTSVYLRVRLKQDSLNPVGYWVLGSAPDFPTNRATGLPTATQARKFDIATNNFSAASTSTYPSLVDSTKYAALRVDSTGKVLGVGVSTSGGSALFQSCWNSFVVGA